MTILFYVGYFKNKWDPSNLNNIGGSEIAILEISKRLVLFGYKVIVSGDVNSGNWNNTEWLSTSELHQKYYNKIDLIIGVNYIHFILEFKKYSAKKIFWAHNTEFHPWYKGSKINQVNELTSPKHIDSFVCVSNWHKEQWSQKYSISPERISVINNGVNIESFSNMCNKVKDRFIWSSAPERGLQDLLQNWSNIKEKIPHASLHIYSPGYQKNIPKEWLIYKLNDVEFKGSVDQMSLHNAMLKAEYWLYLTSYEETYCITALEVQAAGIIPVSTSKAALKETINSGIILKDDETKWQNALNIISNTNTDLKHKVIRSNHEWSKLQTWNARAYDWFSLISNYDNR